MSVVAIKKIKKGKFEISADSIRITGWTQEKDKKAKLWKIDDIIIGTAGLCSLSALFREYVENHKPKTNNEYGWIVLVKDFIKYIKDINDTLKIDDSLFIVIYKEKAWYINGLYIREIKDYFAIGAGEDFALAALYLGHSTKEACSVACELSMACEKPINTLTN